MSGLAFQHMIWHFSHFQKQLLQNPNVYWFLGGKIFEVLQMCHAFLSIKIMKNFLETW